MCLESKWVKLAQYQKRHFADPWEKAVYPLLTLLSCRQNLADIYLFKLSNRNTRKKVWNILKAINENTRTTSMTSFWSFCQLWTYFTHFSTVSIVDFEKVNVSWETCSKLIKTMVCEPISKFLQWFSYRPYCYIHFS